MPSTSPWRTTGTSRRCPPRRVRGRRSSGTTCAIRSSRGASLRRADRRAAGGAGRREELGGERWICRPPGRVCHDWLLRTLRAAGQEPGLVHQADENPTLVALVAAGLGVALIPRLGRGPLPAGVVAVALDPMPVRRLYALWRTGAARRPAIAETVRVLGELWPEMAAHPPR
ncbi:LysR substrate-binding domain-containing protein [Streptomyces qaidamensis]|uniref:LysR substrate-binding domain-containing protein n=1 Tax=Streptomyces qaidamensis TaxID=1783515 RepID=UPI003AAEFE42